MHNVKLVLKISTATWEYFPKSFMLFLQTYVCSLIRTLLYLLAESLWLLRIVSLWTAVSCMLYNAVTPLPHSSILQRQLSQDLHWCNCSQVLWFFAVLQNAVIWTVFASQLHCKLWLMLLFSYRWETLCPLLICPQRSWQHGGEASMDFR